MDEQAVLAIDLGTTTGWAFNLDAGVIISGTWDLHPKKGETEGERYAKFQFELDRFYDQQGLWCAAPPRLEIVYEDVKRHAGTIAAHVYGGLLATLKVWCLEKHMECHGVGVGQIKKFWTGRGNADKGAMIAEAYARGFAPVDDNEADALALLHMRLVEGPIVGSTNKTKTRRKAEAAAAPAKPPGRPVAGRTASGVLKSDRKLLEDLRHKSSEAYSLLEQERAGRHRGSDHIHLDKVDG